MINILPNERIDDLQCKGYRLIQKPEGFCFGVDAVLLADFAKVKKDQTVLDLCTGTGIVPILLAAKTEGRQFTGLEIQQEYANMAQRSVALNELQERVAMVQGDVKEAAGLFPAASFDVVTVNPPYMNETHGLKNVYEPKNIARHEILCSLEDVIKNATYVLKPGGNFYMIHKPFRLAEIMSIMMKYKLEPKRMRLVQPFVDKEATMVLIEGNRGGKSRIKIEPTLIMYDEPGIYSEDIHKIYGEDKTW